MAAVLLVAGTPAPSGGGDTGQRVDIGGGRSLYLHCSGSGSPTVVLLSGLHEASDPWSLTDTAPPVPKAPAVFPGVAAFTRVCTYDRPGTIRYTQPPTLSTRSTPVRGTRALPAMVQDLDRLLTAARVPGPYLLVGHSFGGMLALRYA
ncbi:alpha/beta hydrolase [Streptomyces virginiae]|uniref:alpha/beta fold hydrolase n=1 Tax=Streptomyces virginiae TaxID=1961 RepID=UPI0033AAAF29